jgi:hypothetical protein
MRGVSAQRKRDRERAERIRLAGGQKPSGDSQVDAALKLVRAAKDYLL